MEFGLKGTSRLVADVTGSRHSGLGFTVFWLFTAEVLEFPETHDVILVPVERAKHTVGLFFSEVEFSLEHLHSIDSLQSANVVLYVPVK